MDLGRLRSTEWISGVLSVALVGVMFLDWYESGLSRSSFERAFGEDPVAIGFGVQALNAWEAFAVTDIVLAAAAILGILTFVVTATQQTPAIPVAVQSLTALLTTLASVFVFIRVLSVPEEGLVRDVGPTLGLALTLGITLSAWFGIHNERPGHGGFARKARDRIGDIETLPAPPAAER